LTPLRARTERYGLPAFSPDGRTLAFVQYRGPSTNDVFALTLTPDGTPDGEPRRLTFDERLIAGLDWTPAGASRGARSLAQQLCRRRRCAQQSLTPFGIPHRESTKSERSMHQGRNG